MKEIMSRKSIFFQFCTVKIYLPATHISELIRKNKLSTLLGFSLILSTSKILLTQFLCFVDNSVDNSVLFPLGRHHFLCYTYLSCMTVYIHQLGIYLLLLVAVQSWLTNQKIYFFVSFQSHFSLDNNTHTAVS